MGIVVYGGGGIVLIAVIMLLIRLAIHPLGTLLNILRVITFLFALVWGINYFSEPEDSYMSESENLAVLGFAVGAWLLTVFLPPFLHFLVRPRR